ATRISQFLPSANPPSVRPTGQRPVLGFGMLLLLAFLLALAAPPADLVTAADDDLEEDVRMAAFERLVQHGSYQAASITHAPLPPPPRALPRPRHTGPPGLGRRACARTDQGNGRARDARHADGGRHAGDARRRA